MIQYEQFCLEAVQAVVFTPDKSAFAPTRVIASVLKNHANRYQGEMQALPLPEGVPPEIPRVILQNPQGTVRLEAAQSRINSMWNTGNEESHRAPIDVVRECVNVLTDYVRESSARVARLALVMGRSCKVDHPALELIERFCNEQSKREPFNRSATFEIHNHKEYRTSWNVDVPINSWVRCKSATLQRDNCPIVLVEQDLNTVAADSERRSFDATAIASFFDEVAREADDILKKYFPR